MNKIRGFEKISIEQWEKDTLSIPPNAVLVWKYENIKFPERKTARAAGYDVYSPFDFTLAPNQDIRIPMGWKAYMQDNEKLAFHPRSGLGTKYYVRLANTTGVGDSDYYNCPDNEGHYWIQLRNEGLKTLSVKSGDSVVQCIFEEYLLADGDSFSGNKRLGGHGSTGK